MNSFTLLRIAATRIDRQAFLRGTNARVVRVVLLASLAGTGISLAGCEASPRSGGSVISGRAAQRAFSGAASAKSIENSLAGAADLRNFLAITFRFSRRGSFIKTDASGQEPTYIPYPHPRVAAPPNTSAISETQTTQPLKKEEKPGITGRQIRFWLQPFVFSCSASNSVAARLLRPSPWAASEISSQVAPRSIALAVLLVSGRLLRS